MSAYYSLQSWVSPKHGWSFPPADWFQPKYGQCSRETDWDLPRMLTLISRVFEWHLYDKSVSDLLYTYMTLVQSRMTITRVIPHCISVTCNRLSLALVRSSKLLASQARRWTASFKDSEMYEEELLAVSILMKSNCKIDVKPMVYLGSAFSIIQIMTLTLHWWPKVVCRGLFQVYGS